MADGIGSVGGGNAAGINFSGVASGIDTEAIIAALTKLERRPVDLAIAKKEKAQKTSNLIGQLISKVKSLREQVAALGSIQSSKAFATSSSDTTKITASASSSAVAGAHTLEVTQLATSHSIRAGGTATITDATAAFATGAGTIQVTYDGTSGSAITLDGKSLNDVVVEINSQDLGVTASAVNVGTTAAPDYQLVLTGNKTGASKTISTTVTGTGLAAFTTVSAAKNSIFKVDGLDLSRESNTINDAITGLTFNLLAPTAGGSPVSVTVSADTLGVKKKLTAIVDAYNDVIRLINQNNTYDSTSKVAGAFFGESSVNSLLGQLRNAVVSNGSSFVSDEAYSSLGVLGIRMQDDGTLKVDESKLNTKLSTDMTKVLDFFIDTDTSGSDKGFAAVIRDLADKATLLNSDTDGGKPYEGYLRAKQTSLTDQIEDLQKVIDRGEENVDAFAKQLKLKYAAFEQSIGKLKAQQQALLAKFG
ncbi:MAG: flagellar filament capping protein FliD [Planctomycetes bacterium]|nr:flagellar filament capping protein FliD [Planctomycetota bacterium]